MSPVGLALAAVVASSLSGVPGVFLPRGHGAGERIAAALLWLGAALAMAAAVWVFAAGEPSLLDWRWAVPGGAFALRLDALAAFFLLPMFLVPALGSTYGLEYWPEADKADTGRRLRLVYGLIPGGLGLVVLADNSLLFLAGWEVMAMAAFMAVGTEDHLPAAREASFLYIVFARAATLVLMTMFALLHSATGGFSLQPAPGLAAGTATTVFVLALLGFGLKAGVMPLHAWLPGAHAAAPSHVSALMSGVLIKVGIYGLIRVLWLLPVPPLWWGQLLLVLGVVSGVLGVAFAIGQHDLKRLLAYHSIENIGIIVLGLGAAVLGRALGRADLVVLGLAGCLLHVWNHGLFKALLFLSGGAVVHACHTRELDQLGGLWRQLPRVGGLFLLGSVAICGLPPLNGFVSEWLVYLGLLRGLKGGVGQSWLGPALAAPSLALIGGLAVACFAKVFGAVFLGVSRSAATHAAKEPGRLMLGPMAALAALCVGIGLWPGAVAPALDEVVRAVDPRFAVPLGGLAGFSWVSAAALTLVAMLVAAVFAYRGRLAGAPVAVDSTWGCGYAAPDARMQYTASSFADSLVGLFAWALRPTAHRERLKGPFPSSSRFSSHVADTVLDGFMRPAASLLLDVFNRLRWMQAGNVSLYLAYVAVALVVALAWVNGAFP